MMNFLIVSPPPPSLVAGRTHDTTYNLFKVGHLASAAVKQFVETSRGDLLTETRQSSVFDEFVLPPINSGAGRSESQFFVDGNHSRVSLITRITPSPDWFVGMNSFQVLWIFLDAFNLWSNRICLLTAPLDYNVAKRPSNLSVIICSSVPVAVGSTAWRWKWILWMREQIMGSHLQRPTGRRSRRVWFIASHPRILRIPPAASTTRRASDCHPSPHINLSK